MRILPLATVLHAVLLVWTGLCTPASAAPLDTAVVVPGPQRPPVGRSLFDHLMATADGKSFDIPFPIEKLIAKIKNQTGASPKVVMVPKGRSLQRDRADFDAPRLIYAYDAPAQASAQDLGYDLKDRLYLGFAEHGEQIEVLSYNAAAGRFEYQLVRNYKDGGKPDLVYADRTLCIACHHNRAAIFPTAPWPETNGTTSEDHRIADLIGFAMNGRQQYHGVPVGVLRQVPNEIENAVVRANLILPYQQLWQDGCGGDAPTAPACRASVVRAALELEFTAPPSFTKTGKDYQRLQAAWAKAWPELLPRGMPVADARILNFDALLPVEPNTGFPDLGPSITKEQAAAIKATLSKAEVPRSVDPLTQFLPPLEVWRLDSGCYGTCVIYGINRFFTDTDKEALQKASKHQFSKVAGAVTASLNEQPGLYSNRPFRRGLVMKALLKSLGQPVAAGASEEQDTPRLPAPVFDAPPLLAKGEREPLALMKSYCLPCHTELSGRRGFMIGSDQEVREKIKHGARYVLQRLDWEGPGSKEWRFMPLANSADPSSQHSRLAAHPEDRRVIMDWLKTLL